MGTLDIKKLRQFSLYDLPDKHRDVAGSFLAGKLSSRHLKEAVQFSKLDSKPHLQLHPHQLFVRNFVNIHTPFRRLFVYWKTGWGKTIAMLGTAMRFLNESGPDATVLVLGFTKNVFQNELLRRPEFGFVTEEEVEKTQNLRRLATRQDEAAINRYKDWMIGLRRRLVSRKGNGKFIFMGWKKFTNQLFGKPLDSSIDTEQELLKNIKEGTIKFNPAILSLFQDFPLMVLGDEIHTVYNSRDKNMWGTALQLALNRGGPLLRAMFVSGTPINSRASESVDLLNLLTMKEHGKYKREDFFDNEVLVRKKKLQEAFRGKVSYIASDDPENMPRKEYLGEFLKQVGLKFTRAKMTTVQQGVFESLLGSSGYLTNTMILDAAIPIPSGKENAIAEDPQELRSLMHASDKWKSENGLEWSNGTVGGPALSSNLKKISPKYHLMIQLLHEGMSKNQGKYLMYHTDVHGTGALFVGEVLRQNGLVDHRSPPNDDTLCALCGKKKHSKTTHAYSPAKYVVVHGEMSRRDFSAILDAYNTPDNADGSRILVIVGSRMIGESHDLKAVQNIWILKRPDSVPTFAQIVGRGVRKYSHAALPEKDWVVRIRLFTVHPTNGLGYSEKQYGQKMSIYKVIKEVQQVMHEMAVDYFVGKPETLKFDKDDPLSVLEYSPNKTSTLLQKFPDVYPYPEDDVANTVLVIKRLFIEQSPAWTYKELLDASRHPPSDWNLSWNTEMITEDIFKAALASLCPPPGIERVSETNCDYWDAHDSSICVRGAVFKLVSHGDLFVLARQVGNNDLLLFDAYFRGMERETEGLGKNLSVEEYLKRVPKSEQFDKQKKKFFETFSKSEDFENAICENDVEFQRAIIKDIVRTVFRELLGMKAKKEIFTLQFSVSLLYYYNLHGMIVWASQVPKNIFAEYKFVDRVKKTPSILYTADKECPDWCPPEAYFKLKEDATRMMDQLKTRKKPLLSCDVPVGVSLQDRVEVYSPRNDRWKKTSLESQRVSWKENNLVIGYDEKQSTGIGTLRFKIRTPVHQIEKHQDMRKMERGAICSSRPKQELYDTAKKLGLPARGSISMVCNAVRKELIKRELQERAKNSNIKWFYNHYESKNV